MFKWNYISETQFCPSKSDAYKFLFENCRFTKKPSRSANFKELAKLQKRKANTSTVASIKDMKSIKSEYFIGTNLNIKEPQFIHDSHSESEQESVEIFLDNTQGPNYLEGTPFDPINLDNDWHVEKECSNNEDWDQPWVVLENTDNYEKEILNEENNYNINFSNSADESLFMECYNDEADELCTVQNSTSKWIHSGVSDASHTINLSKIPLKDTIEEINWFQKDGVTKQQVKNKKNKSNNFFLGRTWFRGMSNYYKEKFDHRLKSWEKNTNNPARESMDDLVKDFIKSEFSITSEFSSSHQFQGFLDWMMTVLHSQNHRKNDEYIKERDFKKIRNLLYWYSSHAKHAFISDKNYALIFNNFYNKGAEALIDEKTKEKYPGFDVELRSALDSINKEALKSMQE